MESPDLPSLLREPEGQLLEFKREWYDFSTRLGKATFARDVIAMANGLKEGQVGRIVIGREDPDRAGAVVGVGDTPTVEQLIQALGSATRPVPTIQSKGLFVVRSEVADSSRAGSQSATGNMYAQDRPAMKKKPASTNDRENAAASGGVTPWRRPSQKAMMKPKSRWMAA